MALAVVQSAPAPMSAQDRSPDVRVVVEGLWRKYRAADRRRIAELLLAKIDADPALLRAVVRFVVDRISAPPLRQRSIATERTERRAAEKAAVKTLAVKVRQQIALDTVITLLSGEEKPLRFVLGRELAELGAAYGRIAAQVPADTMVGEVLCEAEAKALLADTSARPSAAA